MKIFIAYLLSVLVLNATVVSKDRVFEDYITPSHMSGSFSIVKKSQETIEIQKLFNKIVGIVKKSDICKGGNYYISPEYEYKTHYYNNETKEEINPAKLTPRTYYQKQKKEFIGYRSKIDFNCTFKNVTTYDKIISKIKELKVKELSLNTIHYKATKNEIDSSNDSLEVDAIKYAKEYSKKLNTLFDSRCKIEKIIFNPSSHTPRHYSQKNMLKSASEATSITTPPIKENLKIDLRVNYTFECK